MKLSQINRENKVKVIFILPALTGGGTERVILMLVKNLDFTKFAPTVILIQKSGRFVKLLDSLPKEIDIVDLKSKRARFAIFKIINHILKSKPDIVFSSHSHVNLSIGVFRRLLPKNIKFIAREPNTISIENQNENYPKIFDWLYKNIYSNFDISIAQSKHMKEDLIENFGIDEDKISVINNPVEVDMIIKRSKMEKTVLPKGKINLLAIGRVVRQKGFDILIKALSHLDERYHLTIVGEGEDEESLKELIIKLDLSSQVTLVGFKYNPYTYLRACDLFILSSRYEGFPNVVLEAQACAKASVAFDEVKGVAEIIEEYRSGILANDMNPLSLSEAIKEAVNTSFDKREIEQRCRDRFDVSKISKKYEELFLKGLNR